MTSVFISYSKADQTFVDQLRVKLEALGTRVVDPRIVLGSGKRWAEMITSELQRSDGIVLIVPQAGSSGANNAYFELGVARALGKPVLAVVPEQSSDRKKELPADLVDVAVMDGAGGPLGSYAAAFVEGLAAA